MVTKWFGDIFNLLAKQKTIAGYRRHLELGWYLALPQIRQTRRASKLLLKALGNSTGFVDQYHTTGGLVIWPFR